MKIECDKCSAKYSIADEKVRGKTFKIRCKKCSNVIIVRDKGVVADPNGAAESGGPGWHLAINGETVGPMGEDEVRQRFAAGEIDKDTAVWQEGFDDWLPLGEIDAFSDLPAPGAEDPFAASANQDDYAVGGARAPRMAAAVAATGTDGPGEPQSPRVSKLTGQRNENSVLFSLDSLQAMATAGAAPARSTPGAAPAQRASANPSKGLATSAPSSEGSGLIDIKSLGSMVGGGGAMAAASAAPQGAADDASLPSFGGGGFGGLASTPLVSPIAAAAEAAPAPVMVQQRSNAPLYIMMIVLILAVGGLGAYIVLKKPEETKTIVQEVPVVAPTVKDDDDDDKKKKDDDDDDEKKDDEKKDEKAAEDDGGTGTGGDDGVADDGSAGTKAGGVKKSSGGSAKKSGGTTGTTGTSGGTSGDTKATKSGGDAGGSPSVDCILDPSKCGAPKKTGGGGGGGNTSGGSTDPGAPEKLAATDIKAGMAGVKDAAKACGPKHGAKPGDKVTVKLSFSGATGTVTKATPQPPHDGTPLGNCVAGALKNAKVIKFKTASQGASYSVTM